jgi:superfamily I DNA/RNA helicase/RecB family exonuclease
MPATQRSRSWPVSPQLVAQIEEAIRNQRAKDALLPVHVVVPNHVLATLLERALFEDVGYLAVHIELAHEFAWHVAGQQALADGLLPIPEEVDLAIVLRAAAESVGKTTPEYLTRAVRMSGFASAALRTLRDVAAAGVAPRELEALARKVHDGEKARLLARVFQAYQARLKAAGLLDRESLYRRAIEALPLGQAGVVLVGDSPESAGLEALIAKAARVHPFAWIGWNRAKGIAPRRETAATAASTRIGFASQPCFVLPAKEQTVTRVQRLLFNDGQARPRAVDDTVRILSAPGESLEAIEIARLILEEAARGVRFQEMAVLLRTPSVYASHLASAFDRAGISAFFVDGVPRVDPAARALGLLLDLVGADLDRAQVVEFLTTARIRYREILGEDARISPARWDRISARAGIVSGLDRWRSGLRAARDSADEREFDDEVALIDSLETIVEQLHGDLMAFPEEGSWREFLGATVALLSKWIDRSQLTEERLERVIAPLDRFAPRPTRTQFLAHVRDLIASQVYREGSLADGRVLVGPTSVAAGLRFRVVFVPGLVERRFPSIARPDPLLLDEERAALSPLLKTSADEQEEERLEFLDACAATAERLILSYPRVDGQSGRDRVPSSFLLRAVRAATGKRLSADDLAAVASGGETTLGRPYPKNADRAVDIFERDLALVASGQKGAARHLLDEAPNVRRARDAERASWRRTLTPWDGLVDASACADALAALCLNDREVSATEVETLATCPYRHFLRFGLRLRAWEEPERTYALDRRDVGNIMHAVLETLFSELKGRKAFPLRAGRLEPIKRRAQDLLDEEFTKLTSAGTIVHPGLVSAVRDQMKADLDDLLEREVKDAGDFVPDQFELEFSNLSFDFARGRTLRFRGYMDRVDVAQSPKRIRVTDYKSGKYIWEDEDEFKGGRNAQLAIYVLAAAAEYPKHEVTESRYYYSTSYGRFKTKRIEGSDAARATLKQILVALDDTVRAGAFAPIADDCEFCDYTDVCGPHKEMRAARKRGDPRLATFYRMREIK